MFDGIIAALHHDSGASVDDIALAFRRTSDSVYLALKRAGRPATHVCGVCAKSFDVESAGRIYCSRACRDQAMTAVAGVGDRQCARCEAPFTSLQPQARFCSRYCYDRYHRRRGSEAIRRRAKLTREAKRAIFERDGWQCYLCERPISPDLATPHPLSGEIDHVKPIGLGGRTTPANLRATHRSCNQEKADQLPPWWVAA